MIVKITKTLKEINMDEIKCNGVDHFRCSKRREKETGEIYCCYCTPHKDCEFVN